MHENTALPQPEILRADDEFIIARGRTGAEQASVLTVTTATRDPSPSTLAQLQHAHALRDELESAWAVRPLALTREEARLTLVLEDPGGQPLDQLCSRPLPVGEFLRVAVGLAGALGRLHQKGLIHKDIKPANLLVHTSSGQVWLTGFGFTSRMSREPEFVPHPPNVLAGTLAYMAPEQTGRMNHSIDARADLYSCGVTLYQMLTGQLPFNASDPMEWVHCHIARQPPHPGQWREDTPPALSAIVMKLLVKTPEERYQTAAGLEADLRLCLAAWDAHGRIEQSFLPGQYDAPDKLLLPDRLYGREAETDVLTTAFERVATEGKTQAGSGLRPFRYWEEFGGAGIAPESVAGTVVSSPPENLTSTSKTSPLQHLRKRSGTLSAMSLAGAMPKSSLCGGSCCRPWGPTPN